MNHPADDDGIVRATQVVAFLQVFNEGDPLHRDGHGRVVTQGRSEEGLVTLKGLALVKLYGDGDSDHTLKPLRQAAERIATVSRRPIEVVRFTVKEHCEWIEP